MQEVAYLSEDSVHILIDEVLAFDGIVRVEVFAQASALAGVQRRIAVAARLHQLLRHRRIVLHLAPSLALRHHASRHTILIAGVLSSTLPSNLLIGPPTTCTRPATHHAWDPAILNHISAVQLYPVTLLGVKPEHNSSYLA